MHSHISTKHSNSISDLQSIKNSILLLLKALIKAWFLLKAVPSINKLIKVTKCHETAGAEICNRISTIFYDCSVKIKAHKSAYLFL